MRNKLFSYTFHSLVLIYFLRSYRTNLISLSHDNSPDSKTDISLFYIFSFPYHLRHFPFNIVTPRIKCNIPREVLLVSRAHINIFTQNSTHPVERTPLGFSVTQVTLLTHIGSTVDYIPLVYWCCFKAVSFLSFIYAVECLNTGVGQNIFPFIPYIFRVSPFSQYLKSFWILFYYP